MIERRWYARQAVKPQAHPPVARTLSGNGEERAAQIERIQERLSRLHRFSEHIATEVAAMVQEVQKLGDAEAPKVGPPKDAEAN